MPLVGGVRLVLGLLVVILSKQFLIPVAGWSGSCGGISGPPVKARASGSADAPPWLRSSLISIPLLLDA
jgi:hypothetical protein